MRLPIDFPVLHLPSAAVELSVPKALHRSGDTSSTMPEFVANMMFTCSLHLLWQSAISGYISVSGQERISGLEKITSAYGDLFITYNRGLRNLEGLGKLSSVSGDVAIEVNDEIVDLRGIETLATIDISTRGRGHKGGSLTIRANPKLSSLRGLEGLRTIDRDLKITDNASLSSLAGLRNLKSFGKSAFGGSLVITNNPRLPQCEAYAFAKRLEVTRRQIEGNDESATCE